MNVSSRFVQLGVSCLLIFQLTSCARLGPDFDRLSAPDQPEWTQAVDTDEMDQQLTTNWWEHFDDPTLNELIKLAHNRNLSLQAAGLRILEARALLGFTKGLRYPQSQSVSAGYQFSGNDGLKLLGEDLGSTKMEIWSVGLDAAWELDMWGRISRGIESANASMLASYASYENILVSLSAEVASSYINYRTFEERLAIAKTNVALQERSLQITKVRFNNATTTELDVRRAETLLMSTKAMIPELELGLIKFRNALAYLLGVTPAEMIPLISEPGIIPAAQEAIMAGIPADLLRRRPDIRHAEMSAAAQCARIGIKEADLYPSFFLSGSIGTAGVNNSDIIDGTVNYWNFIPAFNWKILNYGRVKNEIRVEDARFQQAVATFDDTVLRAYREVEDSLAGFQRNQEAFTILEAGVNASKRSVDLAMIQYRDGAIDYKPVINTQATLALDQDRLAETKGKVALSVIATYKALGGGWEPEEGQNIISDSVREQMANRTDWGKLLDDIAQPSVSANALEPSTAQDHK